MGVLSAGDDRRRYQDESTIGVFRMDTPVMDQGNQPPRDGGCQEKAADFC